jgi:hypothetical protein
VIDGKFLDSTIHKVNMCKGMELGSSGVDPRVGCVDRTKGLRVGGCGAESAWGFLGASILRLDGWMHVNTHVGW